MCVYDVACQGDARRDRRALVFRVSSRGSAATTPARLLRHLPTEHTYRPSTWGMGHLQTYLPSNGIIISYDCKND